MYVRDWMSREVVTVSPDDDIAAAVALLKQRRIRRLAVVDAGGKLVGIVTLDDLYVLLPPDFNPVKNAIDVKPVGVKVAAEMASDVVTIGPNEPLEDVAALLRRRRIGALPVLDGGRLVGIITESDVFEALARVLGAGQGGTRISFDLPDDPHALTKIVQTMRTFAIDVLNMSMYRTEDHDREVFTLRVHGEDVDRFVSALWKMGYRVMGVQDEDC